MSDYARKMIEREIERALNPTGPALHSGKVTLDISHVRYVLAERDALLAQRQWQPIRTAPKDGRAILVWNDISKNCEVVFWNGHWAYQGEDHFGVSCSKWMSLDAALDAARNGR